MIKLIASRLEHVFLDSKGQFDESTFQRQLNVMQKHGIRFVIYSGRSYSGLLTKFANVQGPLDYIAENGAQVVFRGVNIKEKFVDSASWTQAFQWLREKSDFGHFHVILSDRDGSFTDLAADSAEFKKMKRQYPTLNPVPDLSLVGDPTYQIRLIVNQPNVNLLQQLFDQKFGRHLRAINGGQHCLYIVARGVNLATGLQAIQKQAHVKIRQTAAFGRYQRDFNLLNSAKHSYFVKGADSALADVAKPLGRSNGQRAVQNQIDLLLQLK